MHGLVVLGYFRENFFAWQRGVLYPNSHFWSYMSVKTNVGKMNFVQNSNQRIHQHFETRPFPKFLAKSKKEAKKHDYVV